MQTGLRFLRESSNFEYRIIHEQKNVDKPKYYYFQGIFSEADKKNQNGRIYSVPILEKAVDEYQKLIDSGRSMGELEHPQAIKINPENVCHKVVELKKEGKTWIGKSQITCGTPKGDILKALMVDNECQCGVSSRGVGDIDKGGNVTTFSLCAFDVVLDPSCSSAFVDPILEGTKRYMINEYGEIVEVAYQKLEKAVSKLSKYNDERKRQLNEALQNFIASL